jgi:anti-sigma factor RsiW
MTAVCDSAAAYVLGALSASERAEFERHLAECPDCRDTVADLAGIPGLLARVSPDDLTDTPPAPDTLVPRLLRAVRRSGRRRRLVVGALAAAAVVLAVAGTALVVTRTTDGPPEQALTALADIPVTARAALEAHRWGTEITMDCTYTDKSEWSRPYALVAVDDDGTAYQLATWVVGPGKTASISGSVPVQPDQIERLEIQSTSGTPLLRLEP